MKLLLCFLLFVAIFSQLSECARMYFIDTTNMDPDYYKKDWVSQEWEGSDVENEVDVDGEGGELTGTGNKTKTRTRRDAAEGEEPEEQQIKLDWIPFEPISASDAPAHGPGPERRFYGVTFRNPFVHKITNPFEGLAAMNPFDRSAYHGQQAAAEMTAAAQQAGKNVQDAAQTAAAVGNELNGIAGGIAKIIGGGLKLFKSVIDFAKALGLTPQTHYFIIDSTAQCTRYVYCWSHFERSRAEIELEEPDGLIVKFITQWNAPKFATNWNCRIRGASGAVREGHVWGWGQPKEDQQFFVMDDSRMFRRNKEGVTWYAWDVDC